MLFQRSDTNGVPDKDGKYDAIVLHSGIKFKRICEYKDGRWHFEEYGPEAPNYEVFCWDVESYKPLDSSDFFKITSKEAIRGSKNIANKEEEMNKYLSRVDWAIRNAMKSGVFKVSPPFYWDHNEKYIQKIIKIISKNGFSVKRNYTKDGDSEGLTIKWYS